MTDGKEESKIEMLDMNDLALSLTSNSREMAIVIDDQTRIAFVGDSTLKFLNLSRQDVLGRSVTELLDGQLFGASVGRAVESLRSPGDSFRDVRVRPSSQTTDWESLIVDGHRMPNQSGNTLTLLTFRKSTPENSTKTPIKLSDKYYQQWMEQVTDYAIFMTDAGRRAISWNEGVQAVLGYSEDEFIGQDVVPLIFTEEAIQKGVAKWEFETAGKEGSASDDRWMIRKGGETFWASGITTGLHDEDGNLIGFNKVMRDLTDRKQAEDQLRELAAALSEADRRKNEFLATLAHELRNPLSPIKTAAQLMQLIDDDFAELKRLSKVIDRQANQMIRLIDDLMDVSRISRGKISLKKETCDISEIVSTAIEATQPFIEKSGQTLQVELADEALIVMGDPDRLSQSLTNLLNNAAKYTPASGKIWLSTRRDSGEAVIEVRDNGIGLLDGQLTTIFEMFQQVDVSKERGQSGLGIGLSLVKNLIQLHNGTVTAKSEGHNLGSEFTIRLPLLSGHVGTQSHVVAAKKEIAKTRSFRVLVVEDTRAIRLMLVKLLKKLGHEVEYAIDGREGLEKALTMKPDVIFSDISMPEMNGHELAKEIRGTAALCDTTLVALTGFGQDADKQNAMETGFNDYMVKPADIRVLSDFFVSLEAAKQPRS